MSKITLEQLQTELDNGLTNKKIASKYDMNIRSVERRRAQIGALSGRSTLVRHKHKDDSSTGKILEWIKTNVKAEEVNRSINALRKAFTDEVPRAEPVKLKSNLTSNTDMLNLYVISDYHLGMMAWGEETGADWDLNLAEKTLIQWFEAAIIQSQNTRHAVFCNLSDFLHWDGMDAVTPQSKHVLDADSRFQKMVRVCIRLMRKIISMLLEKHETVTFLNVGGNHDPASTVWLREMFSAFYDDEDRVFVDVNPDLYCCYEFGLTSLFFHHGHKRRVGNIDTVFASKFRDVFGRTKHSYAHMGHLHSVDVKETNLMLIEQHRTLAAPDAYAASGGWMSGRDAKVITYHKQFGEVARLTISIDMLESIDNAK